MSLIEIQKRMHQLLRGEISAQTLADEWRLPQVRLAAYQRFVKGHIHDVLGKIYTALPHVLGHEYENIARDFYSQYPPNDYELNHCVESFYGFLNTLAQKSDSDVLLFAAELAELEWHEFYAYANLKEVPKPRDLDGPILNPTLEILQPSYDVAGYLKDFRRDKNSVVIPKKSPEALVVFVFRSPKNSFGRFCSAGERELFAFKMLHDQLSVQDAALASGLDEQAIISLLDDAQKIGFVILPETQ